MANVKKNYEWLYYLVDNTVTPAPDDRIAKVKSKKTKGIEDLAERIVQTRTEYRKDTLINIFGMMNEAKLEFLAQGDKVNDGVTLLEPAITGNFLDDTNFTEGKNSCVINSRVTNNVHKMLQQVKGTYNGLTLDNGGAIIEGITDVTTGTLNGMVTPGKNIIITGKKIRVVSEFGDTVENCITYTNLSTLAITEQEEPLVVNDPSKIILQLPELDPGQYSLTIKTLYSSSAATLSAPRYITSKTKMVVS